MTTADRLREEGRLMGMAEGRAKWTAEGKAEGKAELVMKQMRLKFGGLPASVREHVVTATAAELDQWAERILRAETLTEVLED